jgi:hypothetical protein
VKSNVASGSPWLCASAARSKQSLMPIMEGDGLLASPFLGLSWLEEALHGMIGQDRGPARKPEPALEGRRSYLLCFLHLCRACCDPAAYQDGFLASTEEEEMGRHTTPIIIIGVKTVKDMGCTTPNDCHRPFQPGRHETPAAAQILAVSYQTRPSTPSDSPPSTPYLYTPSDPPRQPPLTRASNAHG